MNKTNKKPLLPLACLAAVSVCGFAAEIHAATISYSTTAPATGANDYFNLTGATANGDNVNNGDANSTFVARNRPAVGQTFLTGATAGTVLTAITLQNVSYNPSYTLTSNPATLTLRLNTVVGTALTNVSTETAAITGTEENRFTNTTNTTGTGGYITLTLATPITLLANTLYGFDLDVTADGGAEYYFQANGTDVADAFAGGGAYSSGNGTNFSPGDAVLTGRNFDRVFVTSVAVPEPSTWMLMIGGLGAVMLRYRRRA